MLTILLLISALTLSFSQDSFAAGRDLSDYITVKSLNLTYNGTAITVLRGTDASQDLDDYPAKTRGNMNSVVVIDIELPQGQTFSSGDTFSLEFRSSVSGAFSSTDWAAIIAPGNINIGRYRYHDDLIEGEFNANAEGLSSFSDLSLITSEYFLGGLGTTATLRYISVAGEPFYFAKDASGNNISTHGRISDAKLQTSSRTNNYIRWAFNVGTDLLQDLWRSQGTQVSTPDTILEDKIVGATDAFVSDDWYPRLMYPQKTDANSYITGTNAMNGAILDKFSKLSPNPGETYTSFRARVISAPMQYGFYNESDGVRFIVHIGRLGIDTPTYSEIYGSNFPAKYANNAVKDGWYDSSDRETLSSMVDASFGSNNVIGGRVVYMRIIVDALYGSVVDDTTIANTATVTYDNTAKNLSANGTLLGLAGSVYAEPHSVVIQLADADRNTLLSGGSFKLQQKQNNSWQDYIPTDGSDPIRPANSSDPLTFSGLTAGTYRVAQTAAPSQYVLSASACTSSSSNSGSSTNTQCYNANDGVLYSSEFAIRLSDTEGAKILLTNRKPYTISYQYSGDTPSNAPALPTATSAFPGDTITVSAISKIPGYTFQGWQPDNPSITISNNRTFTMPTQNLALTGAWAKHTLYAQYNANGATMASAHNENISLDSDGWVVNANASWSTDANGNSRGKFGYYGGNIIANGLTDYNNPNYLNLTRPGYHIEQGKEWNTKPDGTGTSYNQTTRYQVSDLADLTDSDQTIKLYANWQLNSYNLIFADEEGTELDTNTLSHNSTITLPTNPEKAGYTFNGWNTKPDGTGETLTKDQLINLYATEHNQTITFYAQWQKNPGPVENPVDNSNSTNQNTQNQPKPLTSNNPKTTDNSPKTLKLPFIILGASLSSLLALFLTRKFRH